MTGSRLHRLYHELGQSAWIDNLRRDDLHSGALVALRDRGVRGLTSNPTIFAKSITGSSAYDTDLARLAREGTTADEAVWSLMLDDIRAALEVFASVHAESDGIDGFVSVEVDPALAHDTGATMDAARALHQRIDAPNVMIKVPATTAGLPAIETMIAEGRSINVTLIFSLDRYRAVMESYLRGLERRAEDPDADLSSVASVASFFVSRVDTEVDRRLDEIGGAARSLQGTAAVDQAVLAYDAFVDTFRGPRWDALVARGARVQRPLWASTSTKNPQYSDTLYVDSLIGPHTVNTLPDATLEAFDDHGRLERTVDLDVDVSRRRWDAVRDAGVDLDAVAEGLERDGVASFQDSFTELLAAVASRLKS